ncbi:MAG: DinB family protein [Candidatus Latescibacterota bacterium]|nr:MAG: DinB family protein [Candidatus Latescibacterota bacterium]
MTPQKKWFDRIFDNDLHTWMFPNIVERVRGTPARVEERISGLDQNGLTKRDGDKWSVQEHIGHLVDLEPLWIERLKDFEAGKDTLTPADLENTKTHEANHNQKSIDDLLAAFRLERSKLIERLSPYDESFVATTAKHPRLQTDMNIVDLVYFIAEHDDHHLARMTELIATDPRSSIHTKSAKAVTSEFIDAINAHDLDWICDLVTADHVLVDSGGHVIQGTDHVRKAWGGYFSMFPDYEIAVADTIDRASWIVIIGSARGTYAVRDTIDPENSWTIPAAWLAGVRGGRVRHWQVYADNDPVRRILERHHNK